MPSPNRTVSCGLCLAARSSVRVGRVPDLLFFNGPASVADIAPSDERLSLAIGNAASLFTSAADFEPSEKAQEFVTLLKLYQKPSQK